MARAHDQLRDALRTAAMAMPREIRAEFSLFLGSLDPQEQPRGRGKAKIHSWRRKRCRGALAKPRQGELF